MKKVLMVGLFDGPSPKALREMGMLRQAGMEVEYRKASPDLTGVTVSLVVVDELAQKGGAA